MTETKSRSSLTVKILTIGLLIIVLLIPTFMVQSLIREREMRRDETVKEIDSSWGSEQQLIGPILTIPYIVHFKNSEGELVEYQNRLHLLPDHLDISCVLKPEMRYRGIYETVLYNADLSVSGIFPNFALTDHHIKNEDVQWNDITLSVGISDMKGIQDLIAVQWDGHEYGINPGVPDEDNITSGVSVDVPFDLKQDSHAFQFNLDLNGSSKFEIAPLGKTTTLSVESDWGNPSFTGAFLPDTRSIGDHHFEADWKVLHLNRNYPQSWIGPQKNIRESAFGVELKMAVDQYQKTMRTSKYAIMFISLTFLCFFMIELLSDSFVHAIQYLLVGFALVLFYSLLLAISEHLHFTYAYLMASVGMIALISLYTKSFLRQNKLAGLIMVLLILLYSYLFIVLQLQDYALLLGNLGLFVALALVMYLTRKIDWSTAFKSK